MISWREIFSINLDIIEVPIDISFFRGCKDVYKEGEEVYIVNKHLFYRKIGYCAAGHSYPFLYRFKALYPFKAVVYKDNEGIIFDSNSIYAKEKGVNAVISLYPNSSRGDILFVTPVLLRVDKVLKC